MKVALCLYGHFRTFDKCFPNLKQNLLDRYDIDIFGAAWMDNTGYFIPPEQSLNPTQHAGFDITTSAVSLDYIRTVIDKLKPIDLHLDHYYMHDTKFQEIIDTEYHKNPHPYKPHRPKGTLSLNYIKWMSIKMKKEYEKRHNFVYDMVICTRWDMNHNSYIDLNQYNPNYLTISNRYQPALDDIWGCGSSAILDIWGDQFHGLNKIKSLPGFYIAAHEWMELWLNYNNVKVSFNSLPIDICR